METTASQNPAEDESMEDGMEDVSTILKNEIQSICSRLANLGEESIFLSAKVAGKETTKLGSDTGFLFMSKFDICQQFYQFVEDVYSSKSSVSGYKQTEEGNENLIHTNSETTAVNTGTTQNSSDDSKIQVQIPSSHIVTQPYHESYGDHSNSSHGNNINRNEIDTRQSMAGKVAMATEHAPFVVSSACEIIRVPDAQLAQRREPVLQNNAQSSNQIPSSAQGNSEDLTANSLRPEQISTFSENTNTESTVPLQLISSIPPYLPVSIGNSGIPGVFVDQSNLLTSQGFIPQYGISSHVPTSVINAPIVSNVEMEKIDPTGIVNQALVQSGIHENIAQATAGTGTHISIDAATVGNQAIALENAGARVTIPEGLDILQSDDTNKYHFFLEALRYLNPELYPRPEFAELAQQHREAVNIPYVEGDGIQYTDAHHTPLPTQNLQNNLNELHLPNQQLPSAGGQTIMVPSSTVALASPTKKDGTGPIEKKKKKKKKKKKDGALDKAVGVLREAEIEITKPVLETSPGRKPGKGKQYKCDICNQYVETHRDIALHKVMHGGKIPPKCNVCNNRFTTKRGLKHHMQIHQKQQTTTTSPYFCEACDKPFQNKDEFLMHRQQHEQTESTSNVAGSVLPIDYQTGSSYGAPQQAYETHIARQITNYPSSEHIVGQAGNIPVGNVMCTIASSDVGIVLPVQLNQNNLPTEHLAHEEQQVNRFSSERNIELVHSVSQPQSQPVCYVNSDQSTPPLNLTNDLDSQASSDLQPRMSNDLPVQTPTGSEASYTEEDQQTGIMSKFGVKLDLSKMENAADIVLQAPDGTKGSCKVCGDEITSFEQTIVHFTIHKEQQSINESKKKHEKVKDKTKKPSPRHRKGRKYPCETCGHQFLHFNDLCLHRISHKGKSPEKCQVCSKGFTSKRGVRLHMELHKKDPKPYLCEICKIEINDVEEFINHKGTHPELENSNSAANGSSFSESDVSSSSFKTQQSSEVISHTQGSQEGNRVTNPAGDKIELQETLNDIQTIIHQTFTGPAPGNFPPSYEASLSQPPVVQQSSTYANPNMPLNIDPLQIAQMNLFFQQLNEQASNAAMVLQQQEVTHEAQQPGNNLNGPVVVQTELQSPQNLVHTPKEKKSPKIPKKKSGRYACDECSEQFYMFHDLRLHKIIHKGQTPQLCTVCNKLFVSKKGLRDHMTLHRKQSQKNICDICEKEFDDLNQLILHKLEHVEEARTKMSEKKEQEESLNTTKTEIGQNSVIVHSNESIENCNRMAMESAQDEMLKGGNFVDLNKSVHSQEYGMNLQLHDRSKYQGYSETENLDKNIGDQVQTYDGQHVGYSTGYSESNMLGINGNQVEDQYQSKADNLHLPSGDNPCQPKGDNQSELNTSGAQTLAENWNAQILLDRNDAPTDLGNGAENENNNLNDLEESHQHAAEQYQQINVQSETGLNESEKHFEKSKIEQSVQQNEPKQNEKVVEKSKDTKLASELTCLIDHVSNDSTNDEHECPFCRERFSGPESLKEHLYIHMEDSDTPGDETADESLMKTDEHKSLNHNEENVHMCHICGEKFSGLEAFEFHSKKHKPAKQYKCKVCSEIFSDFGSFKNHKKVKHQDLGQFKCEICGKIFNKSESLKRHKAKVHKSKGDAKMKTVRTAGKDLLTCEFCEKVFRDKFKLNEHVSYHTGESPHKCQICYKTFTRASGLKDHMNTHSGRKPYRCDICGKRYADISNWRKHKTSHSNPVKTFPFKCSICKEKFALWRQIKAHTAQLHPDHVKFLRISRNSKLKKLKTLDKK